jgi:hypothetical protein
MWQLPVASSRMTASVLADAPRAMPKRAGSTVAEVKGSHAVNVAQPKAVAAIIVKGATGGALATKYLKNQLDQLWQVTSGRIVAAGCDVVVCENTVENGSSENWPIETAPRSVASNPLSPV